MPPPTAFPCQAGKRVSMRYIGRLKSNGKVFDSNTKGKPFAFRLGERGWEGGCSGGLQHRGEPLGG